GLIQASPSLSDSDLVSLDSAHNRILKRAVLLRDFRDATGKSYKWIIIVRIPKGYPLLQDYIYSVGAPFFPYSYLTVPEAKKLLGPEAVEAAYRKDAEGRQE